MRDERGKEEEEEGTVTVRVSKETGIKNTCVCSKALESWPRTERGR